MVTTALAPHHTSQPRKLTLGKLFLTLHPGNVGRVPDVRVNYAKPFNGTQLVAAVHLPVAASHPDHGGGLHAGEEAATGHQNPGRILEEGFATCPVLREEVSCDSKLFLSEASLDCFGRQKTAGWFWR